MIFRIVAVCSANTCRSPLIAAALERSFLSEGLWGEVMVHTAGLNAVPGQGACPEMMAQARTRNLPFLALERHRSANLSEGVADRADLVLAADRHVRSLAIRRVGGVTGDRIFTLREAAELAVEVTGGAGTSTAERLRNVIAAMNHARGFTELPRTDRVVTLAQPWRPLTLHAHDVPDAHEPPVAPHRLVRRLVVGSAERLVTTMAAATRREPS